MATVEEGLAAQVRNIEATYGRPIDGWVGLIRASGLRRHGEIVAMLKSDHGLTHGAANRVALVALAELAPTAPAEDPIDALFAGRASDIRAIHDRVMASILAFGGTVEVAPKKGYLSLRRRTQFAMLKPAAKHLDVGLILPDEPTTDRLESAAAFNALFTHRVRVRSVGDVDDELVGWLRRAWERAG
jgi:predicted transport protein